MKQRELSLLLKAAIVITALVTLFLLQVFAPLVGDDYRRSAPEMAHLYWPLLLFLWGSSLPFFTALALGWCIASDMGRDRSFCRENALRLKWVCRLALLESGIYCAALVIAVFLNIGSPGTSFLLIFTILAGLVVAVIAAILSHLVDKAVALQQENDLTV